MQKAITPTAKPLVFTPPVRASSTPDLTNIHVTAPIKPLGDRSPTGA